MPSLAIIFEFADPFTNGTKSLARVPTVSYPQTGGAITPGTPVTFISDPAYGAGSVGVPTGLHTLSYTIANAFAGTITTYASLVDTPTDSDWFPLPETAISFFGTETSSSVSMGTPGNGTASYTTFTNTVGQYLWLQNRVAMTQGALQLSQVNY